MMTRVRWIRAAAAASLVLAGCAVTTADGTRMGMRSDRFASYVEDVFRRQNHLLTEIAFASEAPDIGAAERDRLLEWEQALLSACDGLNRLAAARRDARDLGPLRQARLARQAPACEAAVRDVEAARAQSLH